MTETGFIVREPLLDAKQNVIGFEFSWQSDSLEELERRQQLEALLVAVADNLCDADAHSLLGGCQLFLETRPELLMSDEVLRLPVRNTTFILRFRDLADSLAIAAMERAHQLGFNIAIRGANFAAIDRKLLACIDYIEVQFVAGNFASQAKLYASMKQSNVKLLAKQVTTWQDFDACSVLGLQCFVGKLHLTPRPGQTQKGLNSSQATIVQLMEMVRKNADVNQLETVLKRDATLVYKLLRYINSAGFGLRTEIQSLKHAVQILGYSPLYRWLSLLLATASSSGYSPVLLETAIVRGRFAELIGQQTLSKGEAENLFVVGMFSLLDRLLGLPMEEVLSTIQLPEAIREALVTRGGKFGPYLALAEACELNSTLVRSLASALNIVPAEVNKIHFASLIWARNIAGGG